MERYVILGVTGILILMLLSAVITGLKRGIVKSAIRVATIVLSIPLTILTLNVIKKTSLFEKIINSIDLSKFDIDITQLSGNIDALATALVMPIAFIIIFYLISKLTYFIYLIFKLIFGRAINNHNLIGKGISKTVGVLISLIGAFITFYGTFCPLNGYVGVLAEAQTYTKEESYQDDYKQLVKTTDSAKELRSHFLFSFNAKFSDKIFNKLTNIKYKTLNGDTTYSTNLRNEVLGTIELLPSVKDFFELTKKEDNIDYAKIRASVKSVDDYSGDNSVLTAKVLLNYVTVQLGEKAHDYVGDYDQKYFDIINPLLEEMKASTMDTANEKLVTALNIFGALNETLTYLDTLENNTYTGDGVQIKAIMKFIEPDSWTLYTRPLLKQATLDNGGSNAEALAEVVVNIFDELYLTKQNGGDLDAECLKADKTFIATYKCAKKADELTSEMANNMIDAVLDSELLQNAINKVNQSGYKISNITVGDKEKIKGLLTERKTSENENVLNSIANIFGITL